MAQFTLTDGTQVEHELPCYAVKVFNAGKWNTVALFDLTEDGYAMAESVYNWLCVEQGNRSVDIIQ